MGRACRAAPFNGNVLVNLAAHHPALAFAPELLLRAQGIRVAFFDVDGVLTDGGLYISAEGETLKRFHTLDGHGLKLLARAGIVPCVISGRDSAPLRLRLQALGVQHLRLGTEDKRPAAEPAEPQHQQLRAGHMAVADGEFLARGIGADLQRRLRRARQRLGNRQRIVRRLDQLHAEREALFAHHPPHAVEHRLVIVARLAPGHPRGQFLHRTGQVERGGVDQRVEQGGPAHQLFRQRRGERENADDLVEQAGTRL